MKQIIKGNEPCSLIEHRAQQHSSFDNLPQNAKQELRESLLNEQGHICCYCMKRIPEKIDIDGNISYEMKIEHYQCQSQYADLQLTYTNLFAAYIGNKGKPLKLQTCDTKKGDALLTINLSSNHLICETLFQYSANGEISSANNDDEINRQLNEVLNLNMQTLKENRKRVYLEVQNMVKARNNPNRRYFEQERDRWLKKTNGKFKAFCMVAVYYLNKKIRQYG